MSEQKLIDWDTLSENCMHYDGHKGLRVCCSHEDNEDGGCFRIDCPIWNNLDDVTLLEITDITPVSEGEAKLNNILSDFKQVILNQSTVHAPCDARYIARCNPQEEQEIGREQVLDEIRVLIEKWS